MRLLFALTVASVFLLGALAPVDAAAGEAGASTSKPKIPMPGNMDTLVPCVVPCYDLAVMNSTCAHQIGTDDELLGCICRTSEFQEQLYLCSMIKCGGLPTVFKTMNATNTSCHIPYRDYSGRFAAVNIAFMILAIVSALLRVGVKMFYQRSDFGFDDAIFFAGLLSGILYCAINLAGVAPNGIGRDAWSLTVRQITRCQYFLYITSILYCLVMGILKASILAFYLRIFTHSKARWVIWGTFVFCVLYSLAYALFSVLRCSPPSNSWASWDGKVKGKCSGSPSIVMSHAAIGVAVDVWMLAIPLSMLSTLRLDFRRKLAVALMFIVGMLDTVFSILRLSGLVSLIHTANSQPLKALNLTYFPLEPNFWSTMEVSVGIVCACMPSMRILLLRISSLVSERFSSYRSSRGKTTTTSGPNTGGNYYYNSSGGISSRITRGTTSSQGRRLRAKRGSIILSQGTDTHVDVTEPACPQEGGKGIVMSRSYDIHDESPAGRSHEEELDAVLLQDIAQAAPEQLEDTPKH